MAEIDLHFTVNGSSHTLRVEPCRTLLDVLRNQLGLTGTKEACGAGDCGACVVVMDRLAVNSCLVLAAQAQGAEIITVEGLAHDGKLHPLQHYFAEKWALQCGFCTPGMLMSAYALLLNNPHPAPDEIREAISGNLCRCGTYQSVIEAVLAASEEMSETTHG
jgi:aerobic carbon-monoxide dehydrogenase small subunit